MKNKNGKLFFSMTYEYLDIYMAKQMGRSPATIKTYRDALSLFRKFVHEILGFSIASFEFSQCTRECVFEFMDWLKSKGSKPGSRNQRLAAIKSYLWFASDKDVSLQSIALEVKRVPQCKDPKTDKIALTTEELAALFAQPKNNKMGIRDRTIMILLYDSAARLAEILNLQLTDICLNEANPYIRVMGKGCKERVVAISIKTAQHVKQYMDICRASTVPAHNYLFYTVIKGNVGIMSEGNVERFIQAYADKARIETPNIPERVYPHMLRRTKATNLYQNGVELSLISRFLGHSHVETTKVYAKPSLDMMRDAVNVAPAPGIVEEEPLWAGSEDEMARICGLR